MTEKTVDEYFEERGWDITEFYQSLYDRERLADSMDAGTPDLNALYDFTDPWSGCNLLIARLLDEESGQRFVENVRCTLAASTSYRTSRQLTLGELAGACADYAAPELLIIGGIGEFLQSPDDVCAAAIKATLQAIRQGGALNAKALVIGSPEEVDSLMRDILDDEYHQFVIRIRPTHAEALFLDFVDALNRDLREKQEVRMQQGEDELRPKFVDYVEFNYDRLPAQGKELARLLAVRCNEQGELGLPDDGRSLERALRECGLLLNKRMRQNLDDYFSYAKQFKRASNAGRKMPPANHNAIVFGNPGTGKTRFARILAKILIECGVAETVASVDAIDLFGTRVGQTRRNVLKKAEELHRGVLIIENAFALASEQTRSLGDEAVSALVEVMDSWPGELTIILVATSSAADYILEANPDLASRLGWSFALPPCDADLHAAIALDELDESELIIEDMGLVFSELVKLFSYFDGMPQLGGGRFARRVAQEIIFTHTLRTGELAGRLEPEDIPSRERVCEMMRVRHVSGTEEGKLKTARHEAGHVVCDLAQFGLGCVREVTIDPRGAGANGFTRLIYSDAMPSLSFYRKRLVGMYGGMAAELQFYNESFGGVEGDLEQATLYAREMATRLGMEEALTSYPRACPLHELPEAVQEEIESRLRWALDEARVIVSKNAELVDAIAKALMANTALRQREIEDIVSEHGGIH